MTPSDLVQLEPNGGNLFRQHELMVTSGQFWRCAHGTTGFGKNMVWKGCPECQKEDPKAYEKFNKESK